MTPAAAIVAERIVTGSLEQNCYIVSNGAGEAAIVDPGGEAGRIAMHVADRGLTPLAVLITHGHHDHVGAAAEIAHRANVPIHMHSDDAAVLRRANFYRSFQGEPPIRIPDVDVDLAGRTELRFGGLRVTVLHTPGHTPGSVCFGIGGELFTGDTVSASGSGYTDLPESDRELLAASLDLIGGRCPAKTRIHPGHGEPALLSDALLSATAPAEPR